MHQWLSPHSSISLSMRTYIEIVLFSSSVQVVGFLVSSLRKTAQK